MIQFGVRMGVLFVGLLAATCLLQVASQKSPKAAPNCTANASSSLEFFGEPRKEGNVTEGQIVVCEGGLLHRICDESWTPNDANVACRQLGFDGGEPNTIEGQSWTADLPVVSSSIPMCNGTESTLSDCKQEMSPNSADCDDVAVEVRCYRHNTTVPPSADATSSDDASVGMPTMTQTTPDISPTPSQYASNSVSDGVNTQSRSLVQSSVTSVHIDLPPPKDSGESNSVLSPIILGLIGGGAVIVIMILVGIVLTCVVVTRRRCRKAKFSSPSTRVTELEKNSGEKVQQFGWSNPLATMDPGPTYTELSTSLSSPNTPQSATTAPYSHAITPGSSVSDSSHEYEELHESISKAQEYKRKHKMGEDHNSPEPYQLPAAQPTVPEEATYSTLHAEGAYQTLQPFITTPSQADMKPELPPRGDETYAQLDHGKGLTFKTQWTDDHDTAGDRMRSASFDNHIDERPRLHGKIRGGRPGESGSASLDRHQVRPKREKRKRGKKVQVSSHQYRNAQPPSARTVAIEPVHDHARSERSATMPSHVSRPDDCSSDENKRSSLV